MDKKEKVELTPDDNIKKTLEFSKKLLIITDILLFIIVIFACLMTFITQNMSVLIGIVSGVFGLAGTAHGFYFWKAKSENKIKLMNSYKLTPEIMKEIFKENQSNYYDVMNQGYNSEYNSEVFGTSYDISNIEPDPTLINYKEKGEEG